jgi:hypothetical protein
MDQLKIFRFINPENKWNDYDEYVVAYDIDQAVMALDNFAGNEWCSKWKWDKPDLRKGHLWKYLRNSKRPHVIEFERE